MTKGENAEMDAVKGQGARGTGKGVV